MNIEQSTLILERGQEEERDNMDRQDLQDSFGGAVIVFILCILFIDAWIAYQTVSISY